jgi:threonylcarbamoyladenosine tRNA methylthiotransferase MtaB
MIKETDLSRKDFLNSQVGQIEDILIERLRNGGYYEGYSKNYTPVHIFDNCVAGELYKVKITEAFDDYCVGELI